MTFKGFSAIIVNVGLFDRNYKQIKKTSEDISLKLTWAFTGGDFEVL